MFPEVGITIKEEWIEKFQHQLEQLKIEEKPLHFAIKENGLFALFFGQVNLPQKQIDRAVLKSETISLESLGFENISIIAHL